MTGAIDVVENKSWVVIIKLSNKVFFSNLTSALLILRIAFYTYLKLEETVSELVKILPQAFSDNPNWIYNKIHKSTENAFNISLGFFNGNIFDYDWIWYILIEYQLITSYLTEFFHIYFVAG